MSNEQTIKVNPTDPESLAAGLTHINGNLVFRGEAIETLTMLLGVAVAKSDPALADALGRGRSSIAPVAVAASWTSSRPAWLSSPRRRPPSARTSRSSAAQRGRK